MWYHENLKGLPGLTLPPPDPGSSWWLYSVLVPDRDGFIAQMAEQGVEASPVHSRCDIHPAFQRACANPNDPLPGVDHFAGHQVSIPVHWALTPDDRERVAVAVHEALKVTV
jgi:perosamine synthetase